MENDAVPSASLEFPFVEDDGRTPTAPPEAWHPATSNANAKRSAVERSNVIIP